MPSRRDVLVLAAAASAAFAGGAGKSIAAPAGGRLARLETRLFNFRPEVSAEQTSLAIARFRSQASTAGLGGFMLGRNANAQPFPTRFEWMYLAQWTPPSAGPARPANAQFKIAQEDLASLCGDQAICNLNCPLPDGYGAALGVKVRHVVMFSFKPEASSDDVSRNVDAIRAMGRLPMVQSYLVEKAMTGAPSSDQMEWQVIGDFASMADYRAYADAPVHLAIRDDFRAHTSRVAFLDTQL